MKYSRFGYFIGEGFRNVFKNKKSTGASLMIMCATMIMKNVESLQGMQVFVNSDVTEEQIVELGEKIKNIKIGDKYAVNTIVRKDKEEALEIMKRRFKDRQNLLDGYSGENNIFTESYVITLTDLKLSNEVKNTISTMEGVKRINSEDDVIEKLLSFASGTKIVTFAILILLIFISIFIIGNTIKLTVIARRKEISIMKYVGATNNFIRWPFIVEGIIIGIIASLISIAIIAITYDALSNVDFVKSFVKIVNMDLLSFNEMFNFILITYISLGIGLGAIGSIISMRKYLKV